MKTKGRYLYISSSITNRTARLAKVSGNVANLLKSNLKIQFH